MARGKPIVIEFAAKTRDFLRGTRDVERSTDDIADSLLTAGKDAERFEREFQQSMDAAEREASRTAKSVESDFRDMSGEMGDIGSEGASELRQNMAEGLSSGNLEDVVQGTLGGLVSGLSGVAGGATAVLAGVGAAAVNQIVAHNERVRELSETAVATIDALYTAADARWTQAKQNQQVQEYLDENKQILAEYQPIIEGLGFNYNDFVASVADGTFEARGYMDVLNQIIAQEEAQRRNQSTLTEGDSKRLVDAQRLARVFGGVADEQAEALDINKRASEVYDYHLERTGQLADDAARIADETERQERSLERMNLLNPTVTVKITAQGDVAYLNPNSSTRSPSNVAGNGSRYQNNQRP